MTLMSLTAYAATHRASRQAAKKWQDRGYLVMTGDQVDAAASDAKMKASAKGRFRVKAHGGRRVEGERGIVDRPGLGLAAGARKSPPIAPIAAAGASAASCPPAEPWRSDDPTMFGNALRKEVTLLADEVKRKACITVDITALLEMADGALHDEWDARCQTKGWYEWPATIAAALAEEFNLPGQAEKLAASLQGHTVARLTSLLLGPEDFTDPALPAR